MCQRNDWTVVAVFSDNDRSASRYATKARPEHRKLIKFIESGNADVLVTWESSRAQRDLRLRAQQYVLARFAVHGRGATRRNT